MRDESVFYSFATLIRKTLFSPLEDKIHIFKPPCSFSLLLITYSKTSVWYFSIQPEQSKSVRFLLSGTCAFRIELKRHTRINQIIVMYGNHSFLGNLVLLHLWKFNWISLWRTATKARVVILNTLSFINIQLYSQGKTTHVWQQKIWIL